MPTWQDSEGKWHGCPQTPVKPPALPAPRVMSPECPECPDSPDGKHVPDFGSITHSDKAVGDMGTGCILDVNCRHCGRSGAFRVDLTTEIDW